MISINPTCKQCLDKFAYQIRILLNVSYIEAQNRKKHSQLTSLLPAEDCWCQLKKSIEFVVASQFSGVRHLISTHYKEAENARKTLKLNI